MKDKVELSFSRNDVDNLIPGVMNDKQWEVMASLLEDSLIYYLHEEAQRYWEEIDSHVEQHNEEN